MLRGAATGVGHGAQQFIQLQRATAGDHTNQQHRTRASATSERVANGAGQRRIISKAGIGHDNGGILEDQVDHPLRQRHKVKAHQPQPAQGHRFVVAGLGGNIAITAADLFPLFRGVTGAPGWRRTAGRTVERPLDANAEGKGSH